MRLRATAGAHHSRPAGGGDVQLVAFAQVAPPPLNKQVCFDVRVTGSTADPKNPGVTVTPVPNDGKPVPAVNVEVDQMARTYTLIVQSGSRPNAALNGCTNAVMRGVSSPPGADIGPLTGLGVDDNPRANPPNAVVTIVGKITRFNLNATDASTVRFTSYRP